MESCRLGNKLGEGQYIVLSAQKGAVGQHGLSASVGLDLSACLLWGEQGVHSRDQQKVASRRALTAASAPA